MKKNAKNKNNTKEKILTQNNNPKKKPKQKKLDIIKIEFDLVKEEPMEKPISQNRDGKFIFEKKKK